MQFILARSNALAISLNSIVRTKHHTFQIQYTSATIKNSIYFI